MEHLGDFATSEWLAGGATLVLLSVVLLLRRAAASALGGSQLALESRQRLLNQVHALSVLVLLVGSVLIWAEQLRDVALSLFAIAVAVVIATKELLLCLSGAFIRTVSRSVSVGDRVQLKSIRGDVVEVGALTTTLLEVNERGSRQSGRTVVIPNSVFNDTAVFNETFVAEYALHQLRVPVAKGDAWEKAEKRLLAAATVECAAFIASARTQSSQIGWQMGLGPDAMDPQVSLAIVDPGQVELLLRFPAPSRRSGAVEQAILRRYLATSPPQRDSSDAAGPEAPSEAAAT